MFSKILVPLDGGEAAETALHWVKFYGRKCHSMAVLLHVSPEERTGSGFRRVAAALDAQEYLQGIERELTYAGIPVRILTTTGPVAEGIAKTARREKCDLVVMATRGPTGLSRWLSKGVTDQVMRLSRTPLLVLGHRTLKARDGRLRHIVVPLDDSERSHSMLPWAERLARLHRARLIFLHVYPSRPGPSPSAAERACEILRRRMDAVCEDLRSRGVRAEFRPQPGDPATEISWIPNMSDAVAMTTRGRSGFRRLVSGSVAEDVVRRTTVPVFIYRTPALVARPLPEPAGV